MDSSMDAWPDDTNLPLAEEVIRVRNCDLIDITMLQNFLKLMES